jgi:AcrR family transcriptional regulator
MGAAETRSRILDFAEKLFAAQGFHGTSLREVALAADLRQSLVQYHFKSKFELFRAVYERRALPINHDRMTRLADIEAKAARGNPLDPEEIVRAFVESTVVTARDRKSGGEPYAEIVAQIINDPQDHARKVSREFMDVVAKNTLRVLRAALPDIASDELVWCYVFSIGAMVSAIARTGRVRLLSEGECDPDDVERILSLLVPFITGGMDAVAKSSKARRPALKRKSPARNTEVARPPHALSRRVKV